MVAVGQKIVILDYALLQYLNIYYKEFMTEEEAQKIVTKLVELKNKYKDTRSAEDKKNLDRYKNESVNAFKNLILFKTSKYKAFSNYEDLNQEAFIALNSAFESYNPKKGSFFFWFHKYIDTRIARRASNHSVIRFPLKSIKENMPHKELVMPDRLDLCQIPDLEFDRKEMKQKITEILENLPENQRDIIYMYFGLNDKKETTISDICKEKGLTRMACLQIIKKTTKDMKYKLLPYS